MNRIATKKSSDLAGLEVIAEDKQPPLSQRPVRRLFQGNVNLLRGPVVEKDCQRMAPFGQALRTEIENVLLVSAFEPEGVTSV